MGNCNMRYLHHEPHDHKSQNNQTGMPDLNLNFGSRKQRLEKLSFALLRLKNRNQSHRQTYSTLYLYNLIQEVQELQKSQKTIRKLLNTIPISSNYRVDIRTSRLCEITNHFYPSQKTLKFHLKVKDLTTLGKVKLNVRQFISVLSLELFRIELEDKLEKQLSDRTETVAV